MNGYNTNPCNTSKYYSSLQCLHTYFYCCFSWNVFIFGYWVMLIFMSTVIIKWTQPTPTIHRDYSMGSFCLLVPISCLQRPTGWPNPVRLFFFFSVTAAFTSGVHDLVRGSHNDTHQSFVAKESCNCFSNGGMCVCVSHRKVARLVQHTGITLFFIYITALLFCGTNITGNYHGCSVKEVKYIHQVW